jgi:hypothetical protein
MQQTDTDYDVPIFKSLPKKIINNLDPSEKIEPLKEISVINMYKYEVFTNNIYDNIMDTKYIILIIYILLLIIFLLKLFFY